MGDKVCVFVPPTAAEAKRRNRKVKHMSWYRGPCTVLEKTGSIYKVRLDAAPRTVYERTLQNVAPWTASGPAPTLGDDGEGAHSALEPVVAAAYAAAAPVKLMTYDVPPPDTSIFALGDMFIAKDDPTLGVWWMHEVVDVTDDAVRTRIYGTWSPQVKSAVFSPLWTDPQDRISTKKIGATWVPWEQTFLTVPSCLHATSVSSRPRSTSAVSLMHSRVSFWKHCLERHAMWLCRTNSKCKTLSPGWVMFDWLLTHFGFLHVVMCSPVDSPVERTHVSGAHRDQNPGGADSC